MTTTYSMTKDARTGMNILGGLLCLLILTIPIGVWFIVCGKRGKVDISTDMLTAKRFTKTSVTLSNVKRIGVLRVRVAGGGIGGVLARKMCGGPVATNVCFKLNNGKTRTYMASTFEHCDEQIQKLSSTLKLPIEELKQGLSGPKWPESAAQAG